MEAHVAAQIKAPAPSLRLDLPRRGQAGLDPHAVPGEADQPLEDVAGDLAGIHLPGPPGIKVDGVGHAQVDEGIAAAFADGAGAEGQKQCQRQGGRHDEPDVHPFPRNAHNIVPSFIVFNRRAFRNSCS